LQNKDANLVTKDFASLCFFAKFAQNYKKMKLFKIETGFFSSDGGAYFGSVPKLAWQEAYPADKNNLCKMAMRSILIKTEDKLILIDTGIGIKHLDVMEDYGFYGIIRFEEELNKLGFSCNDVTDVVLTHLHFEHCGGCTWIDSNFQLQLTFPNATHWISDEQWKNMLQPNLAEENSIFMADVMEIFKQNKLKTIKEETTLCEGVTLKLFSGHSIDQIVPYIKTKERTYVFVGDVIPTAANVPLYWLSAYDIDQIAALSGKKAILDEAAKQNQAIIFEHDSYTECATIKKGEDFEIEEKVEIK